MHDLLPSLLTKTPTYKPVLQDTTQRQQASVSLILRRASSVSAESTVQRLSLSQKQMATERVDLLLMQRAYRQEDPWSGQIAFPGGRREPSDDSAQAAAVRETAEEMGVHLQTKHYLGRLDDVLAPVMSTIKNIHVSSFVFYLPDNPIIDSNYEVEQAIWMDLEALLDPARHVLFAHPQQASLTMSGIRLDAQSPNGEPLILWGLSLRILHSLFATLEVQSEV